MNPSKFCNLQCKMVEHKQAHHSQPPNITMLENNVLQRKQVCISIRKFWMGCIVSVAERHLNLCPVVGVGDMYELVCCLDDCWIGELHVQVFLQCHDLNPGITIIHGGGELEDTSWNSVVDEEESPVSQLNSVDTCQNQYPSNVSQLCHFENREEGSSKPPEFGLGSSVGRAKLQVMPPFSDSAMKT